MQGSPCHSDTSRPKSDNYGKLWTQRTCLRRSVLQPFRVRPLRADEVHRDEELEKGWIHDGQWAWFRIAERAGTAEGMNEGEYDMTKATAGRIRPRCLRNVCRLHEQ